MKKYLLILMGVLTFFFFSDSTYALTLNDGTEVNKDNYIYYVYQHYPSYFDDYDYFVATYDQDYNKYYNVFFMKCPYFYDSSYSYYSSIKCQVIKIYTKSLTTEFTVRDNGSYNYLNMSAPQYLLYSNYDISSKNDKSTIAFSSNITKEILAKGGKIQTYKITYYLNNEIYKEIEVEEGSSHDLLEYTPSKNYKFSGWTVENDLDLTNINGDINIYGTTTYVRPDMNYSENIDSRIHELSVSIIGKNVPVEFDFVYTIMDFLILLVIVFCIVAPFILVIKLLGGIL